MTIHWSLLGPSVLLLLFPADRLLSSRVELRSFDCFQSLENSPRHRPWWWVPALWLDPVRGFLGTLLLREALGLAPAPWALTPTAEYAATLAVLAAGILCQMFTRRGDSGVLLAPLGFVAGVVFALVPWAVALLALATALLGLFGFRQFHAYFACGLAGVVALGLAFGAEGAWIGAAGGAFALPVAFGIVAGSVLEVPTRNDSGPAPPPRPPA